MEIIRRYDEVIAQKASKTNVKEIYEEFKEYITQNKFLDFKAENNFKFDKISNDL